jgi:formylglycine-generating enzyme
MNAKSSSDGTARRSRRILRLLGRVVSVALVWFAMRHLPSDRAQFDSESVVELPHRAAHDWRMTAGKGWQVIGGEGEDVEVTDANEGTRGDCPPGMVEVRGNMKLDGALGSVEALQREACSSWIDRTFPERCGVFDAEKWRSLSSDLPVRAMHFCVDRFEYPNVKGNYPIIMVTWLEASALCEERGARLCTEDEWTFACEGEEALPFATGYIRADSGCVMDRPWRLVDEEVLGERMGARVLREIDDLWQGEASGANPRCRSPFGVYDTIGNVDEWTRSTHESGLRSILKGGYWGPVRTQCRPATRVHGEDFYFYQIGFRCCTGAAAEGDE